MLNEIKGKNNENKISRVNQNKNVEKEKENIYK